MGDDKYCRCCFFEYIRGITYEGPMCDTCAAEWHLQEYGEYSYFGHGHSVILGTDIRYFGHGRDILGTDTIFWARTSVILGTDISLCSCMLSLTKEIQTMSLTHDRRRKWRKKNKARDTKWRKGRSTCEFCGTSYQNCKRATHMKRKSCRKARGLEVSPRKTRSDKKKK